MIFLHIVFVASVGVAVGRVDEVELLGLHDFHSQCTFFIFMLFLTLFSLSDGDTRYNSQ